MNLKSTLQVVTRNILFLLALCVFSGSVSAQTLYDEEPINYSTAPVDDPIHRLIGRLDAGEVELKYDEEHGYLKAVLDALDIPVSSQVLVYSKTSFQRRRISPRMPRALYFNDNTYIGWVRGGSVVEISAVDPRQGAIFYSLPQKEVEEPRIARHTHECTQCHASTLTQGVPGHMIRSVFTAPDGLPVLSAGTYLTDHTSPLAERWGGWYVTGTHGKQPHMGNRLVRKAESPREVIQADLNVTDLSERFNTKPYLSPHSDIVALLVLEHQGQMHNLITRANYEARRALRDQAVLNEMLNRDDDYRSETTKRRMLGSSTRLLKYMLMVDETKLTAPVKGTSGFAEQFAARGPKDSKERSLRQFDLRRRIFKYPCSYIIYGEAFDGLPAAFRDYVYKHLWTILTGQDKSDEFASLKATDRRAILEILRETKQGLPGYWKNDAPTSKSVDVSAN